ncbi:MAG: ABC transporter [Gammaproteobacteria bacterium]|nr:MAG: ABC transporter [Gammaproteobacteria bacterium]
MHKKLNAKIGLALLTFVFIATMVVANVIFSGWRMDFTEEKLYTLSDGTRHLLKKIEEPIELRFYFSDEASKAVPALRNYAQQIREILEAYADLSGGRIQLRVIDPEPFSEAEDEAAAFGLQPIDVGTGEKIYFGLVGINSTDGQETIPLFNIDRADTLEYDISRLIYKLNQTKPVVVGLITSLPATGGFSIVQRRPTPAWLAIQQLQQMFEVKTLTKDIEQVPADINVLVLLHPKGLSEKALKAIDQFVTRGGRLLVFVDPLAEMAQADQAMMAGQFPGSKSSNLPKLFKAWGIEFDAEHVVLDALNGLEIVTQNNATVRHPGILGLKENALNSDDVITRGLSMLTLSSTGHFKKLDNASMQIQPLLTSSEQAMLVDSTRMQMLRDPTTLIKDFKASGERYWLAVRLTGTPPSAFEQATKQDKQNTQTSAKANIILVADTDVLSDRLWVQFRNFFGQRIAYPWAGNGAFLINAVENLSGSDDLIAIRSRARHLRPFTTVDALRVAAEARFRDKERELQARLTETENKLSELQKQKPNEQALVLSPEQKAAIERFEQERLRIRKELRQVQHQLNQDIDQLGSWLKFLNIILMPIVLTLMLALLMSIVRRRRHHIMSH